MCTDAAIRFRQKGLKKLEALFRALESSLRPSLEPCGARLWWRTAWGSFS